MAIPYAEVPDTTLAALQTAKTNDDLVECLLFVLARNSDSPDHRRAVDPDTERMVRRLNRYGSMSLSDLETALAGIRVADHSAWFQAYERVSAAEQSNSQRVYVGGDNAQINVTTVTSSPAGVQIGAGFQAEAENPRARYYFRFLGQALTQSTVTFILSMLVATAGVTIVLFGAALAVTHASAKTSALPPILTSITGLAITTCGGAMAVHANRARRHAAQQAENIRQDMKSDQAFDRATTLIGQVDDPTLRNRLFALAAVNELGLSPHPIDLSEHLTIDAKPPNPIEGNTNRQLNPGD